ncbi:MAG: adenine deaminase [Puia sp.]|nr:adenine deaminase [Puia sp.]
MHQLTGRLVDIMGRTIYPAVVTIREKRIEKITRLEAPAEEPLSGELLSGELLSEGLQPERPLPEALLSGVKRPEAPLPYILPGFVDAHVHIESSMLVPAQFARLAVVHGTVGTVSDPHEIANVCGLEGVEFMIENGNTVPFKFNFGAPSCVPATIFETAGASLDAGLVEELLKKNSIKYLSEMMNFPGVLNKDPEVMKKIAAAHRAGKPVDGHAPGLRGEQAREYIAAGISTDHECFTAEEALDKLRYGMKILIREGSAAKNFEALIGLLSEFPDQMMFCSDDKHPDSLEAGHIDRLCARAVAKGIDVFKVLKAACVNPVLHYRLDIGLLQTGDPADCIVVEDLVDFKVLKTYIDGELVAENGKPSGEMPGIPEAGAAVRTPAKASINSFDCQPRVPEDFSYLLDKWGEEENIEQVYVVEALDGQLITNKLLASVKDLAQAGPGKGSLHSNIGKDILKMVVVNRYRPSPIAKTFVTRFGLQRGALASSVAHDSHNILAIGVDEESICRAVNLVIGARGGISCVSPSSRSGGEWEEMLLPLPVAGLMSEADGYEVARHYTAIDAMAKSLGSSLSAPFMTLSFMALLVIPHLKISDLGLFDGDRFQLL